MSRKFLVNLIAAIVVAVVAGTAAIFAWYTNTKKSESLDYVSNGLVISYALEGEDNVEEYDVENIVFFDIDSSNEGKYFSMSAVKLTLEISNYSSTAVDVSLKQSIQPFTLSNSITDNVMTIYKYTETSVDRGTTWAEDTYYTFDNDSGYTAKSKYEAGNTYYKKAAYITATLTAADGVLTNVTSVDADSNALITSIDKAGTSFVVGKYVEATGLTKTAFNAGVYYTHENETYTQAKTFDSSTTYYEVNTMAYVGGLTASGTSVTAASITTTGAYVSCVITDQELDSSEATGSVEAYFTANSLSNEFTLADSLEASSAYNTAGGEATVYIYIFGIQLFDAATSNFLENSRNTYPFKLIITANQA